MMPRIHPVEGRQTPLLLRLLNWGTRRSLGHEVLPFKIIAHNPGFLWPYLLMSRFVQGKTELDPALRALAMHLVARINGCAWCIDFGAAQALRHGVTREKLAAVEDYATSPLFSPAERAALAFAAAVTQVGGRVPEAVFAELRRHLSERAIVELTVAVAAENFYNRINAPLELEAQSFCPVPLAGGGWRRQAA